MKKKLLIALLTAVVLFGTIIIPVNAEPSETYYKYFSIHESAFEKPCPSIVDEVTGETLYYFAADAAAAKKNRLKITLDVPEAGTYAVWLRVRVYSHYTCRLGYFSGAYINSGAKMDMNFTADQVGTYQWCKLNVHITGNTGEPRNVEFTGTSMVLGFGGNTFKTLSTDNVTSSGSQTDYLSGVFVTSDLDYTPDEANTCTLTFSDGENTLAKRYGYSGATVIGSKYGGKTYAGWTSGTTVYASGTTCNDCGEIELTGMTCPVLNGVQYTNGTTQVSDMTTTRIVSSIASLDYSEAGYLISISNSQPEIDGENVTRKSTTNVYSSILSDEETLTPASGCYYIALSINDIPNSAFGTTIYIRPYVVDLSGNPVYGDVSSFSVNELLL